jgi:cytochrome b561
MNYSLTAKLMHWLMGIIIIGMLALGYLMGNIAPPQKFEIYNLHKSMGMMLFFLVMLRLVMRLTSKYPELPPETPRWVEIIAKLNILFLYVMMFLMPLSGFLMSSLSGRSVPFFGLFEIPSIIKDPSIGHLFHEIHEIGPIVFILLIIAHVFGGLFHHFILKDNVLRRML